MFVRCRVFFPVDQGCLLGVGYFLRSWMFVRCGFFLRSWMFVRCGVFFEIVDIC